jgi:DNA-binding transcriptional LysR family regulator
MLDVKRLVLLRDLAELGTVTAVAELHSVTPSAVSQQLRALETEAEATLLHREGRTVRLTPAGAVLAAESELVLAALERAASSLRALHEEVSGEITIGCFPSALEAVAAPLAAELANRYPRLLTHIVETEPEVAISRLRHRELDVVVTYRYHHLGTPLGSGTQAYPLFDEPVALAVPEALKPEVERDGLDAVRHHPWILTPAPSGCRDVLLHVCQSAGFTPRTGHSYHDLRAALHLVAAGLGVTILPMLMCDNPPTGVAILPLPGPGRTVETVVRDGTDTQPAIRATIAAAHQVTSALRQQA